MPPPLELVLPRYRRSLDRHRTLLTNALTTAWDGLPSYDAADIGGFVQTVTPYVVGARDATAATSTAFNALLLDIPAPPVNPARLDVTPGLRDPFTSAWHALSQQRPYDEAVQAGRSTLEAVGDSFVTSVARETGDLVTEAADLSTRWRRVAEPNACRWCRSRDGGIYDSAREGNYGHERCRCDVVPDT